MTVTRMYKTASNTSTDVLTALAQASSSIDVNHQNFTNIDSLEDGAVLFANSTGGLTFEPYSLPYAFHYAADHHTLYVGVGFAVDGGTVNTKLYLNNSASIQWATGNRVRQDSHDVGLIRSGVNTLKVTNGSGGGGGTLAAATVLTNSYQARDQTLVSREIMSVASDRMKIKAPTSANNISYQGRAHDFLAYNGLSGADVNAAAFTASKASAISVAATPVASLNAAANYGQTDEVFDINVSLSYQTTYNDGSTITFARAINVEPRVYGFVTSGTIGHAITMYLNGAPSGDGTVTMTKTSALAVSGSSTTKSAAASSQTAIRLVETTHTYTGTTAITGVGSSMLWVDAPAIVGDPALTIASAASVYVAGAPTVTGATLTESYAMLVAGGTARFNGRVRVSPTARSVANGEFEDLRIDGCITTYTAGVGISDHRGVVMYAPTLAGSGAPSTVDRLTTMEVVGAPSCGLSFTATEVSALRVGRSGSISLKPHSDLLYSTVMLPSHTLSFISAANAATLTTIGPSMLNIGVLTVNHTKATTIPTASSVYIAGAPAASGAVTISSSYALWAASGTVRIDGFLSLAHIPTTDPIMSVPDSASGPTVTWAGGNTLKASAAPTGYFQIMYSGGVAYVPYYAGA